MWTWMAARVTSALAATAADDLTAAYGGAATYIYSDALNGFAAQMTEAEALNLSKDPRVSFVEEDSMMYTMVTQTNPPWGLDRIDETDLPLSGTYTYTDERGGRERLHHRHGNSAHAHAVRWPRLVGFDAIRRRPQHQRL